MRISDWSSDVCSSDLRSRSGHQRVARSATPAGIDIARQLGSGGHFVHAAFHGERFPWRRACALGQRAEAHLAPRVRRHPPRADRARSEEHTSELQSLMRISYAVFCLKKKSTYNKTTK